MMRRSSITPPERGRSRTRLTASAGSLTSHRGPQRRFGALWKNVSPQTKTPQDSTTRKKRTVGSPASVESGSDPAWKRRRLSTDTIGSLDEKKSTRKSSLEKNETPPPKGRTEQSKPHQDQTSSSVGLRSSARVKAKEAEEVEDDKKSHSSDSRKAKVSDKVTPKISKTQLQKAQPKDLKDSLANEMKRLSTTEGFWSLRSGSRSGSPSSGVDGNERGSTSQKTSRTSTPEVSPSAVRRKSIPNSSKKQSDTEMGRNTCEKPKSKDTGLSKKQKDKQLDSEQKSGRKDESASRLSHSLPTPELRRLQTTEGFWSPNFSPLPPRNSSRDVSPSSTSSLDRIGRHGARSLSRGSDNRNEEIVMEDDDQQSKKGTQRNSTRSLSRGSDNRNEDMALDQDDQGQKKATHRKSITSNLRRKQDDTRSESENGPRGNLRKGDSGKITDSADQGATKNESKFRRSKGSSEGEKNLPVSNKEGSSKDTSIRLPKLAARHKLSAQRFHRHSLGANLRRTSPQKLMGFRGLKRKLSDLTPRKSMRKTDDTNTQAKIEPEEENVPDPASNKTFVPADSVNARPPVASPEFAISDLLGSAELKRLNTTAGFWAPTPDIGIVLGVLPRRLRDGDIGTARETSNHGVTGSSAQGTANAVKRQTSPVKPQSSLLQHRKKKLQSLKQTLKKNRLLSKGKSGKSSAIEDNGAGKPLKKKRFVYGARKRRGKKGVRIGTKVEPENKDEKELEEKSAGISESVPKSTSSTFSGMTSANTTGAWNRSRRKQQDTAIEESGSSASVITAVPSTSAAEGKTTPTVPEANSFISPRPGRGRPPKAWKRGRHKFLLVNSPRSSSACSPQGAVKTWRRGRRKIVPSDLSGPRLPNDAKSTSQGTPLKTWKRGRKKRTPGTVRPVVLPSSTIRTRAKDFGDLEKSLEVLQSLEPMRKEEQGSSMARISQYQLLYEAATTKGPVVEITDIKSAATKYAEIFGASKPKEQLLSACHVHIDHTYDKTNTQSGDKKDNLFESMGIDLNAPLPDSPVKQNDSKTDVDAIDKSSEKEDNSDITKHNVVNEDQRKGEKSVVSLEENDMKEKSDQSTASMKSGEDEEEMETSDISVCATKQVVEEATATENEQQSEEASLTAREEAVEKQVAENEKENLSHKYENNALSKVSATSSSSSSQMSDCADSKALEETAKPGEPQEAVNADIQAKDILKNEKIEGEKIEIETTNSQVIDEKPHGADKDQQRENVTTSSKSTESSKDIIVVSDSFVQDTIKEDLSAVESAKTELTKDLCHNETAEASVATVEPSEPSAAATEQPETSVAEPQVITTVSGKEEKIDSIVRDDIQQDLGETKINKEETDHVSAEGEVCAIDSFTGLSTTGQASSTTQQSITSALEALRANVHKARLNAKKKKKPKSRFFVRKNRRSLQNLGDAEQILTTGNVLLADAVEASALPGISSIIDSAGDRGETSPLRNPLRRVKKRRKNAWQRGVLRKAVNISRKVVSKLPSSNYSLPTDGTVATAASFGTATNTGNTSADSGNTETVATTAPLHSTLDLSKRIARGKKSAMLKRLQTNANLASADLDEKILKGRFLRTVPAKEKSLSLRRKHLVADPNVRDSSDLLGASSSRGMSALHIDIPVDSTHYIPPHTPRKRGRPRKHSDESLPQLTPTNLHPVIRQNVAWNKAPPRLSPQIVTNPRGVFFPADESKANRDNDFVSESVDETDFHLYLSGVSDEDSSPVKDAAVESFETQELPPALNLDSTDVNSNIEAAAKEPYPRANSAEKTKTVSVFFMPTPTSLAGKEVKKPGRKKMKGRRGRPPGIPMTEEERKRKAEKMDSPLSVYDSLDVFKRPGTARKSMMYSSPVSSNQSPVHVTKFSLRKKSTRSPLEMLEMKRKQEEAMYDMEQERRQARLIHLREKRSARESGDDPSDEGDGVSSEGSLKMCSVVLSDFVKKLQLDNLDCPSDSISDTIDSRDKRADSPDYDPAEDQDQEDEDWCADLEDFDEDDDEWDVRKRTGSRPYIPRLKLKRIMKKGKESQAKRSNPVPILPKPAQHEPIKLLIKTEPMGEFEDGVAKTSSVVDISKMERSGFEGSFLDFLKGKKSEVFMHSKIVSSQKKIYVSKPVQSMSSNMSESNKGTEILSLPTSGSKNTSPSSMIPVRSSTPEKLTADGTGQPNALAPQNTTLMPAITATTQESSEQIKDSSLVEDEEDDILILDLDDGTQDQNSDDSHKEMAVAEDDQGPSGPAAGEMTMVKCQDTPISQPDAVNTTEELQNPMLATNIERDLMMSSYEEVKDQNVSGKMGDSNVITNSADVSDVSAVSATSQTVTTVEDAVITGTSATQSVTAVTATNLNALAVSTVTVAAISNAGATQTVPSCTEVASDIIKTGNTGTGAAKSSKEQDTDQSLSTNMDIHVGHESKSDKSNETETPQKQAVDVPESEKQNVKTSETGSVTPCYETNGNVDQTELAPAVVERGSSVTTNTSMASKSPPNSSVITKRPSVTAENSKSPKHSTYIGSDPEEWRIKIIPQSDKQPPVRYTCKRCGFVAPAKLTIESHIYSHIPGVQFRCAYCESEFSSMTATSTHLKNTHPASEAKLCISRHIDERNFYKEDRIHAEDTAQSPAAPPVSTPAGGQSPPVIISLVVSGPVGAGRGGRSSAPPHRFVCTHCGFSTNVRGDAEHHVSDLHPSQSLFACTLCNENIYYSEMEIKDHSASVHPSRCRPYRKLPDFYDAEQLSQKGKVVDPDDRENIFERMSSIFQDDGQVNTTAIDHRQKAKDYLILQERWREKTSAEADSTTAVDYTDDHDNSEDQSRPQSATPHSSPYEEVIATGAENEVSGPAEPLCLKATVKIVPSSESSASSAVPDETTITSSAGATAGTDSVGPEAPTETDTSVDAVFTEPANETACPDRPQDQMDTERINDATDSVPTVPAHGDSTNIESSILLSEGTQEEKEAEESAEESIGLKIVEVVSLSGQVEDEESAVLDMSVETNREQESDKREQAASQPELQRAKADNTTLEAEVQLTGVKMISDTTDSLSHDETTSSLAQAGESIPTAVVGGECRKETAIDQQQTQTTASAIASSTAEDSSTTSSALSSTAPGGASLTDFLLTYKCNACRVHTPYLLMMVKHLKAKHPNTRCFACPYCKTTQSFFSQKQIRQHVKQAHVDKIGRNEIALSEKAKTFVEALVLSHTSECIRVGNRLVLEEDIHTCTYCQFKMTSLASVYEHLNEKHSDLFEFVCPVCQSFKSKILDEIKHHCFQVHKSSLDTDKVHVSVPKNLFTAITCISKNAKYIEKSLDASGDGGSSSASTKTSSSSSSSSSSTSSQQQSTKSSTVPSSPQLPTPQAPNPQTIGHLPSGKVNTSVSPATPRAPVLIPLTQALPQMSVISQTPLIAIPLVSGGVGAIPTIATSRPVIAFSSALFDTSSLTPPPQLAVTHTSPAVPPLVQNAAAASFLAPRPQQSQSAKLQSSTQASSKQTNSSKNLPVLNVPTVKPRVSPSVSKSLDLSRRPDHSISPKAVPPRAHSVNNISPLPTSLVCHTARTGPANPPSATDNLPEDEPNPDAFKIFNLRPTGSIIPASTSARSPASVEVPTVFPPVSTPISSSYIQGPIAGFPAGMVISPSLLPPSFPFGQQQQPLVPSMLSSSSPIIDSSTPRYLRHPQPSSSTPPSAFQPAGLDPLAAEKSNATMFLKQQQQRELHHLKQKRIQMFESLRQQQLLRERHHKDQLAQPMPKAHPAHQQPPSLSGQVYQPQPLSVSPLLSSQQPLARSDHPPNPLLHHSPPLSSSASTSSLSSASSLSSLSGSAAGPSTMRPAKGQHKRSSSLYQCPYCPTVVTLKALEVASHIQQLHPGSAVVFRKIIS